MKKFNYVRFLFKLDYLLGGIIVLNTLDFRLCTCHVC